jgi:hypothetical protein
MLKQTVRSKLPVQRARTHTDATTSLQRGERSPTETLLTQPPPPSQQKQTKRTHSRPAASARKNSNPCLRRVASAPNCSQTEETMPVASLA